MYELKPGRIADIGVMRWWWWWPMFSLETPWCETSAYVCSLNWLTGPKTYNRLPFLSFLFIPIQIEQTSCYSLRPCQKWSGKLKTCSKPERIILPEPFWSMSEASSGACLEQHLGHIVNNGRQSAVLHASVMPFLEEADVWEYILKLPAG